jgi:hypothetical protein
MQETTANFKISSSFVLTNLKRITDTDVDVRESVVFRIVNIKHIFQSSSSI